ncbi:MAG: vitamin K epoxide reductase family protein [Polyangiaceae bacterium]
MARGPAKWPVAVALVGATVGLIFAGLSSLDYIKHLDRQVHGIHCSILPGAPVEEAAASGCRTAMYSSYAALLKDQVWGGIPIGLFAVGAFAFFIALALHLLLAAERAPRRAVHLLAFAGATPLVVSVVMATISATKLGTFCQTCIGIYLGSAMLAVGGAFAWHDDRKTARQGLLRGDAHEDEVVGEDDVAKEGAAPRGMGHGAILAVGFMTLGVFAIAPAAVYLRSVPSYDRRIVGCGSLPDPSDPKQALLHLPGATPRQAVTMVVDPLCPTCKGFHERLVTEGYYAAMDAQVLLFPLDSECNWNLSAPLHPGACQVSRAILCSPGKERDVLEWAYAEQEGLLAAAKGKDGALEVTRRIKSRWPAVDACLDDAKTKQRLDEMLRFATRNQLPVSTPQLFIGDTKLCDEDVDIGLSYALSRLAPALRPQGGS